MTSRKHPSAALWITVALVAVLVVLVGYPLSEGPAAWLFYNLYHATGRPLWLEPSAPYDAIYGPLDLVRENGPQWLKAALLEYSHWWTTIIVDE